MFSIVPTSLSGTKPGQFTLEKMQKNLNVASRLQARTNRDPSSLTAALNARELSHGSVPFTPTFPTDSLASGTYYLESITASYERIYKRKE